MTLAKIINQAIWDSLPEYNLTVNERLRQYAGPGTYRVIRSDATGVVVPEVVQFDQILNIAAGNHSIAFPYDLPAVLEVGAKISVFALIYYDGVTVPNVWDVIWGFAHVADPDNNLYANLTTQKVQGRDVASSDSTVGAALSGAARWIPITMVLEGQGAGNNVLVTLKREGTVITSGESVGYIDNAMALADRIAVGSTADSTVADHLPLPIAHVAWGTGDALAYHDAVFNSGAFGADPSSVPTGDFTPTKNLPLVRADDGSPFAVTQIDANATVHDGTPAWTALPTPLPYTADGSGSTPVPTQIASGEWTLADSPSAGGDKLRITVDRDGEIEYRIGGGAAVSLGSGPIDTTITVLAGTEASVQVRELPGTEWSVAKTATPTATAVMPSDDTPATIASYSEQNNTSTIMSPPAQAGDLFLVMADGGGRTLDKGTLREDAGGITAWTYEVPATTDGEMFTITSGGATDLRCYRLRACTYHDSGMVSQGAGSGAFTFPEITTAAGGLVFHWRYKSSGSTTGVWSFTPPPEERGWPETDVRYPTTFSSNNEWIFRRTEVAGTSVESYDPQGSYFSDRIGICMSFAPRAEVVEAPYPTQYAADDNGAGLARSSTVSTFAAHKGAMTITLSAPHKVGHYNSGNAGRGDLWVLDEGSGVTISDTSPAFTTDGRGARHGAMLNVQCGIEFQGFDSYSDTFSPSYSDAVRTALPVSLTAGDTIILARSDDATVSGKTSPVLDYVVVTIVDAIPYDDELRPPYSWPSSGYGAPPRFRLSDADTTLLPSLPHSGPRSSLPSMAWAWDQFYFDPVLGQSRYTLPARNGKRHYGRDLIEAERDSTALLCSEVPFSTKKRFLCELLQRAIDVYGVLTSNLSQGGQPFFPCDGGHNHGRYEPLMCAGVMFGTHPHAATMLSYGDVGDYTANDGSWHELAQVCRVDQANIDYTGSRQGDPDVHYTQGMLGVFEWCGEYGGTVPSQSNNHWNPSGNFYRNGGGAPNGHEGIYLLSLALGIYDRDTPNLAQQQAVAGYSRRHFDITVYGRDPWQKQHDPRDFAGFDAKADLYPKMTGAPANNENPPDNYASAMQDAHFGNYYSFPWEV